jgi:hypothetical protein
MIVAGQPVAVDALVEVSTVRTERNSAGRSPLEPERTEP